MEEQYPNEAVIAKRALCLTRPSRHSYTGVSRKKGKQQAEQGGWGRMMTEAWKHSHSHFQSAGTRRP